MHRTSPAATFEPESDNVRHHRLSRPAVGGCAFPEHHSVPHQARVCGDGAIRAGRVDFASSSIPSVNPLAGAGARRYFRSRGLVYKVTGRWLAVRESGGGSRRVDGLSCFGFGEAKADRRRCHEQTEKREEKKRSTRASSTAGFRLCVKPASITSTTAQQTQAQRTNLGHGDG